MLVLTNTAMKKKHVIGFAALIELMTVIAALAQGRVEGGTRLTLAEYEAVLQRTLPCPAITLRETRDFQLCLQIVPPGHRTGEREMLVSLSSRSGVIEMLLTRPEQSLWQYANARKQSGTRDWEALSGLKMRTVRTTDSKVIARVAGKAWTRLLTDVVARGDWYMDATTYRIHSRSQLGKLTLEVQGPGPSADRQPSRLLSWAERVRKVSTTVLNTVEPVDYVP